MTQPTPRDTLIALNATPTLSRPAVYRLGQELDRWLGRAGSGIPPEALAAEAGVPRTQMARALAALADAAGLARREEEAAARLGARVVTRLDDGYPAPLAHLSPPPPVLYIRGRLSAASAVAIVGSRRTDAYGQEVAELFARELAAAGVPVISGFARGIDAAAHRAALAAPGGETVAVLGCGLDVDYPSGHARLGREIAERGAVVTEFPCGAEPRTWHFPVRNRVIAALAAGTLVVQAAPRSGSLITARHALDLGREVWAVPGRIFDERSLGPHGLIRDGAKLVQHPLDILEDLQPRTGMLFPLPSAPLPTSAPALPEPPPGFAGEVLAAIPNGTTPAAEEIAIRLDAAVDKVLGALLELELGGWVRRLPGGLYGRGLPY
ncbi:MAG TPA: DNA-processing protein DprA [Thermoanaerobaculia bacterium]|nr:DNA-processing protein DprA [Thermoanaerobaculia bacterium]